MPIPARRDARTRAGGRESPVGVKKSTGFRGPRRRSRGPQATKLGVRAGLGVGGTGRGTRVGGGAPAGRAGGGKGRNLVLLPVLVRADHPSVGRMGLSATRLKKPQAARTPNPAYEGIDNTMWHGASELGFDPLGDPGRGPQRNMNAGSERPGFCLPHWHSCWGHVCVGKGARRHLAVQCGSGVGHTAPARTNRRASGA